MAENFEDVVKKLGSTVKKPSAAKSPAVLAVQMVDSKGKVIKEEKGAAAAEAQREEEKRSNKTNTLLGAILKAVGGGKGPGGGKGGEDGLSFLEMFGGLRLMTPIIAGIGTLIAGAVGLLKPALILGGLVLAVKDGIDGWFASEEWGVSNIAGALGSLFGGMETPGSWTGMATGAAKWGAAGALLGSTVPIIGTAVGFALGAMFGAILSWIGGEKIAKWFDEVGFWVSQKWDEIKLFPGQVWQAIVDTIKGWIGIKPDGTVPVTVEEDKPVKGWLDSLTEFLIPPWLKKFAEDALGTVTGWLGLTKEDDQGKITNTRAGKLIFGTIGLLADFAMQIIDFFIPQFVKDFVAAPLDTVMLWLGLKEVAAARGGPAGMQDELTTTERGKNVFGVVGDIMAKVKNIFEFIVTSVIGKPTYDAIVKFASGPVDYILEDVLGWRDEEGVATAKGLSGIEKLEKGGFAGFFITIVKAVIGDDTYKAIVSFAKNPVDYILVNWLEWQKPTTGRGRSGDGLTAAGTEALAKIDSGNISGFWTQFFTKIFGFDVEAELKAFGIDPVNYIWKKYIGFAAAVWIGMPSTIIKSMGTSQVGGPKGYRRERSLWDQIIEKFIPKGLLAFINDPVKYILTEWMGWDEEKSAFGGVNAGETILRKIYGQGRAGHGQRMSLTKMHQEDRTYRVGGGFTETDNWFGRGKALTQYDTIRDALRREEMAKQWFTVKELWLDNMGKNETNLWESMTGDRSVDERAEYIVRQGMLRGLRGHAVDGSGSTNVAGHVGDNNAITNIGVGGGTAARRPIYMGPPWAGSGVHR
jgi:hypothetical protein